MVVNIDDLIQTFVTDKGNEEKTYTKNDAYKMGQQWLVEQQRTVIKEKEAALMSARKNYFEAIQDYRTTIGSVNMKVHELQLAVNQCFYTDQYPFSMMGLVASQKLQEVTHFQVHNYELHLQNLLKGEL